MLKQYVEDCWTEGSNEDPFDRTLVVNPEAKVTIKKILPQGLYDPNSKVSYNLFHTYYNVQCMYSVDPKRRCLFYFQYCFV